MKWFQILFVGLIALAVFALSGQARQEIKLKRELKHQTQRAKSYAKGLAVLQRETEILRENMAKTERENIELKKEMEVYAERLAAVRRILRGRPLYSFAADFLYAEKTSGPNAELLAAISIVESGGGKHCYGYNAFGILVSGEGSGLRRFSDWPSGILAAARFIKEHWGAAQSPYELTGYSTDGISWMNTVSFAMTD